MSTNTKAKTPLGDGIVQGKFTVRDGSGASVSDAVLVRLPINDVTREKRSQSNCMTPRAELSGLWVFAESDLQ